MDYELIDVIFDDYETVKIGKNTQLWNKVHIGRNVKIGHNCKIGDYVYIGNNVFINDGCKIQNNVFIPNGVVIDDNVFIGPSVTFTNVKYPRADYPAKEFLQTIVGEGVSIGANSTILCGLSLGRRSMIGAGSVVTRDVGRYTIVAGNPARKIGVACYCGANITEKSRCTVCGAFRGAIND